MVYNVETGHKQVQIYPQTIHMLSLACLVSVNQWCSQFNIGYNFMSRYFAVIHIRKPNDFPHCWGKYISEKLFDNSPSFCTEKTIYNHRKHPGDMQTVIKTRIQVLLFM